MSEYDGKYDPRDFTGKKIRTGDLVAYPVRRGSLMTLKSARVAEWSNNIQIYPDSRDTAIGKHIRKLRKPKVTYKIVAINDNGRRIVLTAPDRIIVLEQADD